MKLPSRNFLNKDQLFLYKYDTNQFFNANPRYYGRFFYNSRFLEMTKSITSNLSSGLIVDVGCAQANFSITLAGKGYQAVGIDLRPAFVAYARLKVEKEENKNISFVVGSAEHCPINSESCDGVILGELLEHTSRPVLMVEEAKRVLKPGGYLFISTPNGGRVTLNKKISYDELTSCLKKPGKHKWVEFSPDKHVFEFRKNELAKFMEKLDFELVSLNSTVITESLIRFLCSMPFSVNSLKKIQDFSLRFPLVKREIAATLLYVGRKQ